MSSFDVSTQVFLSIVKQIICLLSVELFLFIIFSNSNSSLNAWLANSFSETRQSSLSTIFLTVQEHFSLIKSHLSIWTGKSKHLTLHRMGGYRRIMISVGTFPNV